MTKDHGIREMGKSVGRLALPVLIEQIGITLMGVVNTALASNMGKEALAAIGMIDSISNIIISIFGALAIGGTVVVAQHTGREDHASAVRAALQAIVSCLVIAMVITVGIAIFQRPLVDTLFGEADRQVVGFAYDYLSVVLWSYVPIALISIAFGILRGSGDTRKPMRVSLLMNLFNVVFSYILIYGIEFERGVFSVHTPSFGVRGAALGLTLARLVGAGMALTPLFRGSSRIRLEIPRRFRFDLEMQKCIFRLGIPASMEQLMFNSGKLIVTTFIVRLGTVAMAANAIAGSIVGLLLVPGGAMAITAVTVVGQQIGRGQPKAARRQLGFLVLSASAVIGLLGLLVLPFLDAFLRIYTQDPATLQTAKIVVWSALIAQPLFWSASFVIPAGLRGAGDVRFTMTVSIISMWTLRILLGYLFTVLLPFGILGIWLAMYADWVARTFFFVRRLTGDRWVTRRS